jgi:hypothetical protein
MRTTPDFNLGLKPVEEAKAVVFIEKAFERMSSF